MAAAPAGASSLTYIKGGNVWLTDPGGAKQYQVTFDGGYSSPSQADDGTIVALQNRRPVRMDRSGRQLNAPVDGIGTDPNGGEFYGPYEPKVSPDGKRIAYWFGRYEQRYDYGCSCYLFTTENYTTWTWADHFKPYTDDGQDKGTVAPSWLTNDRLLATYPGFFENVWTWKLDSGHANYDAQWSFSIQDDSGTYYDFGDAEVSPDGSRFAATAGGDATSDDQLFIATTNGPLWVGEPPYDNGLTALPAQPTLRCGGAVGKVASPTWSPDSRERRLLARRRRARDRRRQPRGLPRADRPHDRARRLGARLGPGRRRPLEGAVAAEGRPCARHDRWPVRARAHAREPEAAGVPRRPQGQGRDRRARGHHAALHALEARAADADREAGRAQGPRLTAHGRQARRQRAARDRTDRPPLAAPRPLHAADPPPAT